MTPQVRRIIAVVGAVAPLESVRRGPDGAWLLRYDASVTPAQQAAGDAALAGIDWSGPAQVAWQLTQDQTAAQARWDAPEERLLRALALVLLDELNTLRQQHGLPARTAAQLKAALRQKLSSGDAG
jgi:hypothetical protein